MSANIQTSAEDLKVYTTPDGRVAIEQSTQSIVMLSSDQILR